MDTLAERIRLARTRAKMTQEEFAQAIGSHKNTVGRWERGLGEPDIRSVSLLCEKLGISPYWLLNGDGPMLDKDREVVVEAKPGMKAGDLDGYKLSEVRGGPAFDTSMAKLQAKWREIASALPEGSEDADMEKAFLYHQIKQLEAELADTKEELLKAKDEAIRAQNMALQTLTDVGLKHSNKVAVDLLNALQKGGGYKDVIEMLKALHKEGKGQSDTGDEPATSQSGRKNDVKK